jgi:hypothetical protein
MTSTSLLQVLRGFRSYKGEPFLPTQSDKDDIAIAKIFLQI